MYQHNTWQGDREGSHSRIYIRQGLILQAFSGHQTEIDLQIDLFIYILILLIYNHIKMQCIGKIKINMMKSIFLMD